MNSADELHDTFLKARAKVNKERINWWEMRRWDSVQYYLLKSIGRTRFDDSHHHPWVLDLIKFGSRYWRGMQDPKGRKITKKLLKRLCDDETERLAFEAVWRLHGTSGATKTWLYKLIAGPEKHVPTKAERAAARRDRLEKHARSMLSRHEKAFAREKLAVARWKRKVVAYDRARARNTIQTLGSAGRPIITEEEDHVASSREPENEADAGH